MRSRPAQYGETALAFHIDNIFAGGKKHEEV